MQTATKIPFRDLALLFLVVVVALLAWTNAEQSDRMDLQRVYIDRLRIDVASIKSVEEISGLVQENSNGIEAISKGISAIVKYLEIPGGEDAGRGDAR